MKSAKTIDEMIKLFEDRELIIADEEHFRDLLYNNNYYRLSGYFRVFQIDPSNGDNRFIAGTTEEDFIAPYILDAKLRALILQGISILEITLRSRFAYEIAQDGHAYDYVSLSAYKHLAKRKTSSYQERLILKINDWIEKSSEVCTRHYHEVGKDIPVWAAVEVLPFDTVSKMLSSHIDSQALRQVYKSIGLPKNPRIVSSIVHAMVYLRNLCAHHSRLWKRETIISVPHISYVEETINGISYEQKSVAASLILLMHMVDFINHSSEYSEEILSFLRSNNSYVNGLATPVHWK
ncbi:MAG: Abi family protein [Alloscardovia omnicolens]|nr:Abi family protein [Alloscardovia omnicolens]